MNPGKILADLWMLFSFFRLLPRGKKRRPMGKTIVFNTVRTLETPMIVELFLARCLSLLGNKLYILFDDGLLPHWDSIQYNAQPVPLTPYLLKHSPRKKYHKLISALTKYIFKTANIKFLQYTDIVERMDELPRLHTSDIKHARSSVTRFFKENIINLDTALYNDYLQLSLKNAQYSKAIGKFIYKEISPDLFVTSHGIYSTWGPCYDFLRQKGIPSLVWGINGTVEQSIYLYDTIRRFSYLDSNWKEFKRKTLNSHQRQAIIDYFNRRISLAANDTKVYFVKENSETVNLKKTDELVVGLFPGVIWDGDVESRNILFDDLVQWMTFSIDILRNSGHKILIRFHPSEATVLKGTQSLEYVMHQKYGDLNAIKNLTIISSDRRINTYQVISQNIDLGIIYDGTLGFELPYLNVPTISCSRSRYTDTGIVFEPTSKQEYQSMLEKPIKVIDRFKINSNQIYENLLKYAYWWFIESAYHFPLLNPDKYNCIDYKHLLKKELNMYTDVRLKRTMHKIMRCCN